jgi:hypothetical protein
MCFAICGRQFFEISHFVGLCLQFQLCGDTALPTNERLHSNIPRFTVESLRFIMTKLLTGAVWSMRTFNRCVFRGWGVTAWKSVPTDNEKSGYIRHMLNMLIAGELNENNAEEKADELRSLLKIGLPVPERCRQLPNPNPNPNPNLNPNSNSNSKLKSKRKSKSARSDADHCTTTDARLEGVDEEEHDLDEASRRERVDDGELLSDDSADSESVAATDETTENESNKLVESRSKETLPPPPPPSEKAKKTHSANGTFFINTVCRDSCVNVDRFWSFFVGCFQRRWARQTRLLRRTPVVVCRE